MLFRSIHNLQQSDLVSVFVQANNACMAYNIGGFLVPDNVEITLIKKRFVRKNEIYDKTNWRELTLKNDQSKAEINIDHILCGDHDSN